MTSSRSLQRGLSLVELMVGIAIGLFIVAAATVLVSSQLTDNRRLLLETQIQQDLRATADVIARDLRRAGYNVNAVNNAWFASNAAAAPLENPYADIDLSGTSTAAIVRYHYSRAATSDFELRRDGDVICRRIGGGACQPLTDDKTLKVTAFSIDPQVIAVIKLPCPNLCTGNTEDCWPTVQVRDLVVTIKGETLDGVVKREIQSRVRVRNDAVAFNAPGTQVCP